MHILDLALKNLKRFPQEKSGQGKMQNN